MAGEPEATIIGNVTGDPEMRFTQQGVPVANFTVASTPRTFDRQSNEWKDGETLFMRCSVWRDAAENVAETLKKGMRVIVHGSLTMRSYEKDGATRSIVELKVDEVGPSLRYARATVTRTQNSGGGQQAPQQQYHQQGQPQQQYRGGNQAVDQNGYAIPGGGYGAPVNQDPWSTGGPSEAPF